MGIKIEQTKFVVLPEGEYRLRIMGIAEAEGKFHDQLQLKLEVANGPHAGTTFYSWMNRVFSPKSKLYMWVEAALAVPVPPDYDLDTDDLLGREVTGYVIVKPLDGGGEVNRVERVRAAREVGRFEKGRTDGNLSDGRRGSTKRRAACSPRSLASAANWVASYNIGWEVSRHGNEPLRYTMTFHFAESD